LASLRSKPPRFRHQHPSGTPQIGFGLVDRTQPPFRITNSCLDRYEFFKWVRFVKTPFFGKSRANRRQAEPLGAASRVWCSVGCPQPIRCAVLRHHPPPNTFFKAEPKVRRDHAVPRSQNCHPCDAGSCQSRVGRDAPSTCRRRKTATFFKEPSSSYQPHPAVSSNNIDSRYSLTSCFVVGLPRSVVAAACPRVVDGVPGRLPLLRSAV
jgi:hypothetical protein